jgi:hypothetical protein
MLKRFTPLAAVALLVALAAIVPAPPAQADRPYQLCDPFKSTLCNSLVALYEFEEDSDFARTGETGGLRFLEPDGANVARSSTHKTGTLRPRPHRSRQLRLRPAERRPRGAVHRVLLGLRGHEPEREHEARPGALHARFPRRRGVPAHSALQHLRHRQFPVRAEAGNHRHRHHAHLDPGGLDLDVVPRDLRAASELVVELPVPANQLDAGERRDSEHRGHRQCRQGDAGDFILGGWLNTSPAEYRAYKVDQFAVWGGSRGLPRMLATQRDDSELLELAQLLPEGADPVHALLRVLPGDHPRRTGHRSPRGVR